MLAGVLLHMVVASRPIHFADNLSRSFDAPIQHVNDITVVFVHVHDIDTIDCSGVAGLPAGRGVESRMAQAEKIFSGCRPLFQHACRELNEKRVF